MLAMERLPGQGVRTVTSNARADTPARGTPAHLPHLMMGDMDSGTEAKIDRIVETTTDTRLAVATLSGEVREVGRRVDVQDVKATDFEQRLRALERWRYGFPAAAAVMAGLALALNLWQAFGK